MRELPILFNGPMVRAVLDGRKTQTRRVVKPRQLELLEAAAMVGECQPLGYPHPRADADYIADFCPYGQPGDRLWVRETFLAGLEFDDNGMPTEKERVWYRATDQDLMWYNGESDFPVENPPWKPSIHMPRWASRITLEVTGVRVERLDDIGEEDAKSEGIERVGGAASVSPWRNYRIGQDGEMSLHCSSPVRSFMTLWESINGPGSWDANPWVWAVEFKRIGQRPGAGEW